jgi:PAS domain S-box-containing protein
VIRTGSHADETAADANDGLRIELERCRRDLDASRKRVGELEHGEQLLAGENRVLEMVARGAPLSEILTAHCQLIEELSPGSLCGILLYDQTNNRVEHGAGPSLPEGYNDQIHQRIVTPEAGPCGKVLCLKEQIIAADIAADSRWEAGDWRDLALAHGLRACWSTPIIACGGNVLGTFAIYWHEPRIPTGRDQKLIEQTTHLAAVAIERRRTENALLESESRFRHMADAIPEVIWFTALDPEKVLYVSPSFERIWGVPITNVYRNPRLWIEIIHPDDRERVNEVFSRWIAGEQINYHDIEYRILRPNGETRWIHERRVLTPGTDGKPCLASGISTDITERRQFADKLLRSEQSLTEAIDTIPGLVWVVRPDGEVDFLNERWRSYTGLTLEQARGWGWSKAIHPDDLAHLETYWRSVLASGKPGEIEARMRRFDGKFRWFLFRTVPLYDDAGKLVKWYGQNTDIDDRKCAEEAVRAAKARFEGILDIADDAIISVDSHQRIMLFNQGAEKVFGYAQDEVIGKSLDLLIPSRFVGAHKKHVEDFAKSGEVARAMGQRRELFGRRKTMEEFPAEASISKLDLGGELVFTVILRDVTQQKRLETRLRRSEQNLAEGQHLTKTGSWILDFKTGNTDWSVETCRIFGFPDPPPSPHYREFWNRVRPEDREGVDRGLRESFETGQPRPLEYIFILPDGSRKHIETVSQPFKDEDGEFKLMGTVMDVTERKQAEDAIRASEEWARGQADALARTLDALARETSSDRVVEHVLQTITVQLEAQSSSVWLREEATGLVAFEFALEQGKFKTKSDSNLAAFSPSLPVDAVWPWPEVFRTGRAAWMEDIRTGPEFPWRQHVLAQGIISILIVPMIVSGKVAGVLGLCFREKRSFRTGELELAQAMANQAMLAIQLMRLSQANRESAVIAERNRMARDLHDTLAQGFTGVITQLEAAQGAMASADKSSVSGHIERAEKLARASLGEARRSVRAMRSRSLVDGTLSTALDDLLKRMTSGTELQAELTVQGEGRPLPPDWDEGLLRIAQESLTNTIKYAQARRFRAALHFSADTVRLQLVDDGRGFNPQVEHDGFGLIGMRERAEQMAGTFILRSSPGQGTEIVIELNHLNAANGRHENHQA